MPYLYLIRDKSNPKSVTRRTPGMVWEMVGQVHPDGWWTDHDFHVFMAEEWEEGGNDFRVITPQRAKEIIVSNGWKATIA